MKNVIKLCAILGILQMSNVALAVNQTWVNFGGDQDWFNDSNWADGLGGGATPGTIDEAHINGQSAGASAIVGAAGSPATVGRVVLDSTGELEIEAGADLNVLGQSLSGNGFGSVGDLIVDGTYTVGTEFAMGNSQGSGTLTVGANGVVNANGQWLILAHLGPNSSGTGIVNGGTINVVNQFHIGWEGTGDLTLNGGLVSVGGVINLGVNAAANGSIVINTGEVASAGLNIGNNVGSGSLLMETGTKYTNNGGFVQTPGSTVTINGTAEFEFLVSPLEDVQGLIFGNPDWIFSGTPKITGSLGSVIVTNAGPGDIAGDFDFDGGVDGRDFLEWQRGHTAMPLSGADLNDWETNYGTVAPPLTSSVAAVPEPSSILQFGILGLTLAFASRKRFAN